MWYKAGSKCHLSEYFHCSIPPINSFPKLQQIIMLPSQFLISASAFLAALTAASPNPRFEIIVTVKDSSAVNDAP